MLENSAITSDMQKDVLEYSKVKQPGSDTFCKATYLYTVTNYNTVTNYRGVRVWWVNLRYGGMGYGMVLCFHNLLISYLLIVGANVLSPAQYEHQINLFFF